MSGRGRAAAWLTGAVLAMVSVTLVVVSAWWEAAFGRARANLGADSVAVVDAQVGRAIWWGLVLAGFPIVGVFLLKHRRRNVIGWLFCGFYLCVALVLAAQAAGSWRVGNAEFMRAARETGSTFTGSPVPPWADALLVDREPLASLMATILLFTVVLLFPTGRLPSRAWVWVPALMGISLFLLLLAPGVVAVISPLLVLLAYGGVIASVLGACASMFWRYRRTHGIERLQIRCGFFGVAVALFVAGLGAIAIRGEAIQLPMMTAVAVFPLATGYAIIRYRLYGIDAVIHRGLVLLLIALFGLALYAASVVTLDVALGRVARPGVGTSVVAATVVALCVLPARLPVERWVSRVVYGRTADARTVLSSFSTELGQSDAAQSQLVLLARLIAEATGATTVRVWVRASESRVLEPAAAFPDDAKWPGAARVTDTGGIADLGDSDLTAPITHDGVLMGALTLTKEPGNPVTAKDRSIVEDLAQQAGLVLRNVELTTALTERVRQLSTSRQQLLSAQDAARRQLERDLHDGAQHHLLSIKLKVAVAEMMLNRADVVQAQALLGELLVEADEAIGALRDLARGIYPPLLEARGIAAALASETAGLPVPVNVSAAGVGRYPLATEATVYFCVMEAIQNVVKHAAASEVVVTLHEESGVLAFEVEDDGRGFDSGLPRGSGLNNMEDRLQAAGGSLSVSARAEWGTRVKGRIPVPADAEVPN